MSTAVLNPQFFSAHPPDREFFQRLRGQFLWNAQVLPVYEWNELVFIAAVSPSDIRDQTATWPEHWILVQCEAGPLADIWEQWQDHTEPRIAMPELNEDTSPPVPIPGLKNDEPAAGTPKAFVPHNSQVGTLSKPRVPIPSAESVLSSVPPKSMPAATPAAVKPTIPSAPPAAAGVSKTTDDFDPDQLFASTGASTSTSSAKNSDDLFANLQLEDGFPELPADHKNTDASVFDEDAPPVEEEPSGFEMPEGLSLGEDAKKSLLGPAPIVAAEEISLSPDHEVAPTDVVATTDEPAKVVAAPPKVPAAASPAELSAEAFPQAMINSLIKQVPDAYNRSFFAIKAGNSLRMMTWPESFHPPSGAETDFSLSTPSPFRICTRTEKSYHGYLIASPFLDNFFKNWNDGVYPELMSVVPVAHPDGILGFIIALGSSEAMTKKHLAALEKMAAEALNILVPAPARAKAS